MSEVSLMDTAVDTAQQATESAPQVAQQTGWGTMIVYCIIAFAFIYFFMVRPNKRRMAEYQKMLDSIKIGDRVMAAGIYGTVKGVGDKTLDIEISKGVVIEVSKNAVAGIEK